MIKLLKGLLGSSNPPPQGAAKSAAETDEVRQRSRAIAKELGFPDPAPLPSLEVKKVRSADEILRRFLTLYTVSSVAYGFESASAQKWLAQEGLSDELTPEEKEFLASGEDAEEFELSVEALWAFAWALSLVPGLDFSRECDNNFVRLFPDLKSMQPKSGLKGTPRLRKEAEIVQALDLAYCLHWGIVEATVKRKRLPGKVAPYVIRERRKALEWCLSEERWDDVTLDT